MAQETGVPENKTAVRILIALAIGAACLKLVFALTTDGTNDIYTFWSFNERVKEIGALKLYQTDIWFNHPPFIVYFLRFLDILGHVPGLPFRFWLRFVQIAADAGSLYLIYRITQRFGGERFSYWPLWLTAIAPASVFISGFHGNNDPLMMFFVLLAVYHASVTRHDWFAGLAFGMACNIKVWPLALAPVFFFYRKEWDYKLKFVGAALGSVLVWWLPFMFDEVGSVLLTRILGYRSTAGCWGITRFLAERMRRPGNYRDYEDAAYQLEMYVRYALYPIVISILAACFLMNRLRVKPTLFRQCGIAANLFMALSPGFGVQYIAWLAPWVAWTSTWYSIAFHAATGVFLFLVYTFWSGGFPWHFANAGRGLWQGKAIVFEIISWVLVVLYVPLAAYSMYRRHAAAGQKEESRKPASPARR